MNHNNTDSVSAGVDDGLWPRAAQAECLFCHSELSAEILVEAEDWFFRAVSGRFGFSRCGKCRSLVLCDPLRSELLPLAYSHYYTHGDTGTGREVASGLKSYLKNAYLRRRFSRQRRIDTSLAAAAYRLLAPNWQETDLHYRCLPPAPASVLDYGCGDGEFLARIRALGYEATGIDMDAKALANARGKSLEVYSLEEAENAELQGRFDAVTLAHVIEHVPDPATLLGRVHGWLKPGGLLYLEAPNAHALGLEIFGSYWRGLEVPRHLALPSVEALTGVLHATGFREIRQCLRKSVRPWLWAESMDAAPDTEHGDLKARMQTAHTDTDTLENAEFITLLALRAE